jgi:thiol-disulfide isomerase/thioredoxin
MTIKIKFAYIIPFLMLAGFSVSGCNLLQQAAQESGYAPDQTIVNSDSQITQTGQDTNSTSQSVAGRYQDYSPEALKQAQASGGKAVLFFKASWCPTCSAADKDFRENLSQIPDGVTILKVDYDTQIALKQKYGITIQDTFVQLDSQGNQVSRWTSGGQGLASLLNNLT